MKKSAGILSKDNLRRWVEKYGLPLAIVLLVWLILALRYDFYFVSNDDSVMNSILSGRYTGIPEAHDIYHLYPLAWLLTVFYRICPQMPWYGLFLCGCQFGSIYACLARVLEFVNKSWQKVLICFLSIFLFIVIAFEELVLIQFTFSSAMLAAAAIFLVATDNRGADTTKRFLVRRIQALFMYTIAFSIRWEMGVLLFPFFVTASLYQCLWNDNEKENPQKHGMIWIGITAVGVLVLLGAVMHAGLVLILGIVLVIVVSILEFVRNWHNKRKDIGYFLTLVICLLMMMGVVWAIDTIAYSSEQWKDYKEYNSARIQWYDYGRIPSYQEAADLYEKIGISPEEQALLEMDNFALSGKFDTAAMKAIEEHQKPYMAYKYTILSLKRALVDTAKRFFAEVDRPYNILLVFLYLILAVSFVIAKKYTGLLLLGYDMLAHTLCWGYLLWGNRVLPRVTQGLYCAEILLLAAICFQQMRYNLRNCKTGTGSGYMVKISILFLSALGIVGFWSLYDRADALQTRMVNVSDSAKAWDTVQAYCEKEKDRLYLLDTQSFSFYSEKIFYGMEPQPFRVSMQNFTLCGGWVANMPNFDEKVDIYGADRDLLDSFAQNGRKLFFITDRRILVDWLENYLDAGDYNAALEFVEEIVTESIDEKEIIYDVYQIDFLPSVRE